MMQKEISESQTWLCFPYSTRQPGDSQLVVGTMIGSVSVISEAIHSGVDLLAAMIALFAVRKSGKPADQDHPFGHGKVENISGTVEALLIFLAAGWIIFLGSASLQIPNLWMMHG